MQMAANFGVAAAVLCSCVLAAAASQEDHPIDKVITLIQGLIQQVESEGKEEALTYAKFEHWCQTSVKTLDGAIAQEKSAIDSLNSVIEGKTEEEALLTEQIAKLEDEIVALNAAGAQADTNRGDTASAYSSSQADYRDTIKALTRAIKRLGTAKKRTAKSMALAQTEVQQALALTQDVATEEQRNTLMAFVQHAEDASGRPILEAEGDYNASKQTYDFKSDSVIEMLKQLKLKFEDDKLASTKAETNSINAYNLAKSARDDLKSTADASKAEKIASKGDAASARAKAEADLGNEEADLQADSNTLDETHQACDVKKMEWTQRSETRSQELEAMNQAIEILSKATGVRSEAPKNPVPPPSPMGGVVFFQVPPDPKTRAVKLLRESARTTHSHALERLAEEIAAHKSGPFDQVNNMIQKMIFRLMDEQKEEDKHKNWCDLEVKKTDDSISDKAGKLSELNAKIQDAQATVGLLAADIQLADEMVAEITAHMKEATSVREIGKKENKEALKDAQDAQAALSKAIAVLETFYKDTGMVPKESWELLQKGVTLPDTPSTWDSSYTGVSDPVNQPDGIITVLKKVSEEFSTMEAETRAQEQSDQNIYKEDMKLCDIEKARRAKQSEMKTQEKNRLTGKIADLNTMHKHVSGEHAATEQYLKDLQHACVDGDSTYEDRRSARSLEIEALTKAQDILTTAFQDTPKRGFAGSGGSSGSSGSAGAGSGSGSGGGSYLLHGHRRHWHNQLRH